MTNDTTKLELLQSSSDVSPHLLDDWFDPIEDQLRKQVRGFIEEMIRSELDDVLSRPRYGRRPKQGDDGKDVAGVAGHRHGSRDYRRTGARRGDAWTVLQFLGYLRTLGCIPSAVTTVEATAVGHLVLLWQ